MQAPPELDDAIKVFNQLQNEKHQVEKEEQQRIQDEIDASCWEQVIKILKSGDLDQEIILAAPHSMKMATLLNSKGFDLTSHYATYAYVGEEMYDWENPRTDTKIIKFRCKVRQLLELWAE
jgi:hypothetical protein